MCCCGDILAFTQDLFGRLSARALSDINHSFNFWNNAYTNSIQADGYKDKDKSVVSVEAMCNELSKIRHIIEVFRETQRENRAHETVNDILLKCWLIKSVC